MTTAVTLAKLLTDSVTAAEALLVAQHDAREERLVIAADAAEREAQRLKAASEAAALSAPASEGTGASPTNEAAATPQPAPSAAGPPTQAPMDSGKLVKLDEVVGAASEATTKQVHRLLVHSIHAVDTATMCRSAVFLTLLERVADIVGVGHDDAVLQQIGLDLNLTANVLSLLSNLCVFEESRAQFPAPDLAVSIALTCVRHQPTNRRLVHLALTTIANVALCGDLPLSREACEAIADCVVPIFDEAPVVEAWACAMCNVAATTVSNLQLLVAAGAIKRLEALLQYHGDNDRVMARGIQCLSCLCVAHVPATKRASAAASPTSDR